MKIAVIGGIGALPRKIGGIPGGNRPEEFGDIYLERFLHRVARYQTSDLVAVIGGLVADMEYVYEYKKMMALLQQSKLPIIAAANQSDPCGLNLFKTSYCLENGKLLKLRSMNDSVSGDINFTLGEPGSRLEINCENNLTNIVIPPCRGEKLSYAMIEIDEAGNCRGEECDLKMSAELGLYDFHIHTSRAYCAEDLTPDKTVALMKIFNLRGGALVEHSGQLFYALREYWSSRYNSNYPENSQLNDEALAAMLYRRHQAMAEAKLDLYRGIELDVASDGRVIGSQELDEACQVRLGAIHAFDCNQSCGAVAAEREFLIRLAGLCRGKIDILAHPFRVLYQRKIPLTLDLMAAVAGILKQHGIAAEINFHCGNKPELEFFAMCLAENVKLTFGSDTHASYEVGEFYPHWELIKQLGIAHDYTKYFWSPTGKKR